MRTVMSSPATTRSWSASPWRQSHDGVRLYLGTVADAKACKKPSISEFKSVQEGPLQIELGLFRGTRRPVTAGPCHRKSLMVAVQGRALGARESRQRFALPIQ